MFLDVLKQRNPDFIKAAVDLHQKRRIPSNCYLLDLDQIRKNAAILRKEAEKRGMKIYGMTKQIGREPEAIRALVESGITHFVAVDIQCARAVVAGGGELGHVGHLVQIPMADIPWMVAQKPEYWTVFSLQQAEAISSALPEGQVQKVLLRVHASGDTFYRGHEGGFPVEEITEWARKMEKLKGIRFAGITSFPCLLFDNDQKNVYTTPNLETLKSAIKTLEDHGFSDLELNTPGTTSTEVLSYFDDAGGTQVEPGHGLTGTTPLHAVKDLPEGPAVLYLSEISHFYKDQAYCYGGGLYVDPVFPSYKMRCLTSGHSQDILSRNSDIEVPADNAIDYFGMLHPSKSLDISIGDSVILGFRPQIFVTRGYVASISGISSGYPKVEGISYADGRRVEWP